MAGSHADCINYPNPPSKYSQCWQIWTPTWLEKWPKIFYPKAPLKNPQSRLCHKNRFNAQSAKSQVMIRLPSITQVTAWLRKASGVQRWQAQTNRLTVGGWCQFIEKYLKSTCYIMLQNDTQILYHLVMVIFITKNFRYLKWRYWTL